MIVETEKSPSWPSVSWRTRKASGITNSVQRLENQSEWYKGQSVFKGLRIGKPKVYVLV